MTGAPIRVIVVEDNKEHREMVKAVVASLGWEAVSAEGVEEGLRRIKEAPPDIVITDIHLVDETGLELCRRIRRDPRLSRTPVLMVTGTDTFSGSRQRALEAGADAYLLKPFRLALLISTLQDLLQACRARPAG